MLTVIGTKDIQEVMRIDGSVLEGMAKKYELNDFTNAFNEINRGSSIRAAGRKYGIPYTTLVDKLRNRSGLEARKGPRTVLNPTGGQILRIAIATSVVTKKGVVIEKIRAGRKKGGLAAQHLKGIELVQELCEAKVEDAHMGSSKVSFAPGRLLSGNFSADACTAGSVALMLQVAFPCCLFSDGPTELTLKGGTNAEFAPQIDYVINVFKPTVKLFGAELDVHIRRRGFFPAGNGEVQCRIQPVIKLTPVQLNDFGDIELITGEAFVAGKISDRFADDMAAAAKAVLKTRWKKSVEVSVVQYGGDKAYGNGWGINLYAKTSTGCVLGASQLGRPGLTGKQVGKLAAEELAESIDNQICVDQHLQDQLPILMAFAEGKSVIRTGPVTLHTETAIHILSLMTSAKFNIQKCKATSGWLINCIGMGLVNSPSQWKNDQWE